MCTDLHRDYLTVKMKGTKMDIQLVLLVIVTAFTVSMATKSAIECINACWSFQNPQNLVTVLECIADPPLEDTMCIVACDSRKKNFAFKSICTSCQTRPPLSGVLCTVACEKENLENFGNICNQCEQALIDKYE